MHPDAGYRTAYLLGWDHAAAKCYAVAQSQFDRARAAAPPAERWRVDEALAWLDLLQGRRARAKTAFETILRQHARAHLSRKGLGYIALEEKRFGAAVIQLRASYRLEPKQVVTSYSTPADRLNDAGQFPTTLRAPGSTRRSRSAPMPMSASWNRNAADNSTGMPAVISARLPRPRPPMPAIAPSPRWSVRTGWR